MVLYLERILSNKENHAFPHRKITQKETHGSYYELQAIMWPLKPNTMCILKNIQRDKQVKMFSLCLFIPFPELLLLINCTATHTLREMVRKF